MQEWETVARLSESASVAPSRGSVPSASRTSPFAAFPPVLAGIRAGKTDRPAFPCTKHSGDGGRPVVIDDACLPLRGQHTLTRRALCFPFNCGRDYGCGHQNGDIVRGLLLRSNRAQSNFFLFKNGWDYSALLIDLMVIINTTLPVSYLDFKWNQFSHITTYKSISHFQ
jgi:hypothetical protein